MELLTSGLTTSNEVGSYLPVVAEAVPSVENGLWTIFPDGRTETTYRLREGFTWHDGVPVTAADYVFAMQVRTNPDVPRLYSSIFRHNIESLNAPDARTLVVTWKAPYIYADRAFDTATTMPRHLLEEAFAADPSTIVHLPYFTTEYVSNGPYKMREFDPGTKAMLDAYDGYALGRPKIDVIELRFIPDANTMLANVLAGEIDVLLGARHLGFDQALEAQQRWAKGKVVLGPRGWSNIYPQMFYSDPETVQRAQYRRALFMAVDRETMSRELQGGLTEVAHSVFPPYHPWHQATLHRVSKWEYDPRRSAQTLEEMGFRKGPDGFYVKPNGQPLNNEIRTTSDIDTQLKQMFVIHEGWNALGVRTAAVPIPNQRQGDLEYRSTNCCFENLQGGEGENGLIARQGPVRTAENNWRGHRTNYVNPDHIAMINRFLTTVPMNERIEIAGDLLHHLTSQALVFGLYWVARPTVISNRVTGPVGRHTGATPVYNVTQWDIVS